MITSSSSRTRRFLPPQHVMRSRRRSLATKWSDWRGWDDLIVRDAAGETYSVPTVPLDQKHLAAFQIPAASALQADPRYTSKIKWYLKPIAFGGDPGVGDNLVWVDHA